MGSATRLRGVQSSCLGMLRALLCPLPHPLASTEKVCNLVRIHLLTLNSPGCVDQFASFSRHFSMLSPMGMAESFPG